MKKTKLLKRWIGMLLTVAMVFCMTACNGGGEDAKTSDNDPKTETNGEIPEINPEQHTIAVACMSYNTEIHALKDYCENYLADELNLRFIFSEELGTDPGAFVNFIENAYSGGAEAVVDFASLTEEGLQVAADKCEELGLYFASWMSPLEGKFDGYEYILGSSGKDPQELYDHFYSLMETVLDGGEEPHSIVVCTVNAKTGSVEHIQSSSGALSAIQKLYDLKFDDDIENLVKLDSVTEIKTGRDDVKVTIFPTFSADDLNEVMKSGEYDTVVVVGAMYLKFESTIAEIEKAYDKNIRIVALTSVSDSTKNSYETKDITGDSSLNGALLMNSGRYVLPVVLALNGVNGDADAVMKDGKVTDYFPAMWSCNNAEEYTVIDKLDRDENTYVYTAEDVKQMVKYYNPDVTPDTIEEWAQKAELEAVKERRGIKE